MTNLLLLNYCLFSRGDDACILRSKGLWDLKPLSLSPKSTVLVSLWPPSLSSFWWKWMAGGSQAKDVSLWSVYLCIKLSKHWVKATTALYTTVYILYWVICPIVSSILCSLTSLGLWRTEILCEIVLNQFKGIQIYVWGRSMCGSSGTFHNYLRDNKILGQKTKGS